MGGFPLGYITEIYGPPQGGRSSIVLSCIRANQDKLQPVYIDTEFKFDPHYARKMGVNLQSLFLVQSSNIKDIISIIEHFVMIDPSMIIIDSLAPIGDRKMIGNMFSKIGSKIRKQHCFIYTNQIRFNVKSNVTESYGGTTSKFYPSLRMYVRNPRSIVGPQGRIGTTSEVTVTKASLSTNERGSIDVDIYYGRGFWPEMEILQIGTEMGYIHRKGSWYYYNELCLGEGKWQAVETLSKLPILKSLTSTIVKELHRV